MHQSKVSDGKHSLSTEKIAERRAEKIEALLGGKSNYGDDIFSELQINKFKNDEGGITYEIRLAKVGDTIARYQLHHPPLYGTSEAKLSSDRYYEGGRFRVMDSEALGRHIESVLDGCLATLNERPIAASLDWGLAGMAISGTRVFFDRFQEVVHRASEFLSGLQKSKNERPQNRDEVSQLVLQAQPYLELLPNGNISYTSQLFAAAATIQRALYAIPPSQGIHDYEQRVLPHYRFIDETIWQTLMGSTFKEAVRRQFEKRGIHCHSPEALEHESDYFVSAVRRGDTGRLSEFLRWSLEEDPEIVDKILRRLG